MFSKQKFDFIHKIKCKNEMPATYNVQILSSHSSRKPKVNFNSGTGIYYKTPWNVKYWHYIVRTYYVRSEPPYFLLCHDLSVSSKFIFIFLNICLHRLPVVFVIKNLNMSVVKFMRHTSLFLVSCIILV